MENNYFFSVSNSKSNLAPKTFSAYNPNINTNSKMYANANASANVILTREANEHFTIVSNLTANTNEAPFVKKNFENLTLTNNLGVHLYCVETNTTDIGTWIKMYNSKTLTITDSDSDSLPWWVYNLYSIYGDDIATDQIYYGTIALKVVQRDTTGVYHLVQTPINFKSIGTNFSWKNNLNYDCYNGASFDADNVNIDISVLNPERCGLNGFQADFAHFVKGGNTTYTLEKPNNCEWEPNNNGYTYFTTKDPTNDNNNYVWFVEQASRGQYSVNENGEILQNGIVNIDGSLWARAYCALTCDNANKITSNQKYGIGEKYGTWSIDVLCGDDNRNLCECFYLTERPYLSPENAKYYIDGQTPGILEIDLMETFWKNYVEGFEEFSCVQGNAFYKNFSEKTDNFPFTIHVSDDGYTSERFRCQVSLTPDDIVYKYFAIDEDGFILKPLPIQVTVEGNSETVNILSLKKYNPTFNAAIQDYLKNNAVYLYPYISVWVSGEGAAENTTTKYKNFQYAPYLGTTSVAHEELTVATASVPPEELTVATTSVVEAELPVVPAKPKRQYKKREKKTDK